MSGNLVLSPSDEEKDSIISPTAGSEVKSESIVVPKAVVAQEVDDDLEDGEIDSDDDNDEPIVSVPKTAGTAPTVLTGVPTTVTKKPLQHSPAQNIVPIIDLVGEPVKKAKSKKHQIVEDDFAGSIESAIAAALKKDGIMPPMPKILESRDDIDKQSEKDIMLSKSSRRRKRRKLRDEREREKDKKKHRTSSPDTTRLPLPIDEELDDDEMLCVRGGSPPPSGLLPPPLPPLDPSITSKKDLYDSDDSYSSYDSYDSGHNYSRYSSSRKKDGNSGSRSKRKERSSSRRDDDRRSEKRSRRNYDDSGGEDKYQDRHPQQPRKLELCKFYLMECCAKKDKCSYMHSDFPCKYYYLGMECVYRSACKFSHGKPLTDQLRNVLLKHLETAPKEILGTFRRISRENALNLMNATHAQICEEHGVDNTMAPSTMTTQTVTQTQAHGVRNGDLLSQHQNQQQQQEQQQQQQQNQQQQQQQHHHHHHHPQPQLQQQQQHQTEIIPSLLDMVINISPTTNETTTPGTMAAAGVQPTNKSEKQRKSRWCDSNPTNLVPPKQNNLEPPSSSAPSYLDLKNLTGILSTDRIEKLSKFGVVNLEQINQLTLSQLNNIGLTITEISEIQLNAQNMARLGIVGARGEVISTNLPNSTTTVAVSGSIPSSQDVDMRFLPSCLPLTTTTTTTMTTSTVTSEKSKNDLAQTPQDSPSISLGLVGMTVGANLQDSGSSSVGGIDYSQYLRDSNLGYDKNDLLDDEKDEEQLVIDDQELDGMEDNSPTEDSEAKEESENDSKGSAAYTYSGGNSNDARLPPTIQLSAKLQDLLKDPANLYTVNVSALLKNSDALSGKIRSDSIQPPSSSIYDDDNFYSATASNSRRDIDSREEYRDSRLPEIREDQSDSRLPENKEEYRDPRLSFRGNEQIKGPSFSYQSNNSDEDSDRSRSQSPTLAQQMENFVPLYERQSMYDWTPKCIQEDLEYSRRNTKADKDMRLARFLDSSNSDIDLRLPFQPVKNIQIAKEIDASMSTLLPIPYKISEIEVPEPKYSDLRQSFQCDDSTDPRLRRIFGLPELSNSKVLAALGRPARPTIASPSSVESSSSPTPEKEKPSTSAVRGPRVDPRRAAAAAAASTVTSSGATQNPVVPTGNPQQNVEIRMLLQKSEWYKNLNSKYKIMVNQQLALVSTELKRFHQDPSPNKVFDIQFIVSNQSLQQILTNLGIYIDDNGEVAHIENDNDMVGGMELGMNYGAGANSVMMMNDPNISIQQRMAMQQQMEFLRGPPPNMNMMGLGPGSQQGMFGGPGGLIAPQFERGSRFALLGMAPGTGSGRGGQFNQFVGNPGDGGTLIEPNYCGQNNPFANNFGNFGGQMSRGNRNNYNRQGGGAGNGNNGGNRMNQNRRNFKPNNQRDRRGGGGSSSGGGGAGGSNGGAGGNQNGGMDET